MKALNRLLNDNPKLAAFFLNITTTLSVQRGLPMVIGLVLVVFSLIASSIVIPIIVSSSEVPDVWGLLCIPTLILHLGLISGFLGFMLSAPLGRSYRE